jgi:hypothetical protein
MQFTIREYINVTECLYSEGTEEQVRNKTMPTILDRKIALGRIAWARSARSALNVHVISSRIIISGICIIVALVLCFLLRKTCEEPGHHLMLSTTRHGAPLGRARGML